MTKSALDDLAGELAQLEAAGLRRVPGPPLPPDALSFCSNDYLGLASLPPPIVPSGSGAARLIAGERSEHQHLEARFAEWMGFEAALAFTSGWAANTGMLSALARSGDLVVSDALNHASLIDGARLSRARIEVVGHNDVDAVERALARRSERRAWVVVESYYSMDADGPDLRALRAVCDGHGAAMIVDEAHAAGVLGPGGRGRCAEAGIRPDVMMITLGKSFGSQGALVAGPSVLREWLWNRARPFVFSTGLAPVAAAAGLRGLEHLLAHPELPARVLARAARLRQGFSSLGGAPLLGFGHVVPLVVGDPVRAMTMAARLREHGIHVHAVRPPTVPEGSSRLRFTVSARHTDADIDRAVAALKEAM